ncbi:excinuclease ATPase subunit [Marinobacter mangrovi]|uniref:excinuclease ATPase subunit n=1 Tax=Marinobacter mangrovi TaxID=2803918 RepID=UPI0019347AFE|nr:excinuclease ATPase subunit [Marinobacter mangrovi]
MKNKLVAVSLVCVALLSVSPAAFSRDTKHMMSIDEAMASADFQEKLDPSIQFTFGDQHHGAVESRILSDIVTNKKTNAFMKSDEEACRWVFLSALLALQDRAKSEGGNAIINIKSYYKKNEVSSNTDFECHAGAVIAGVALKGDIVKIK